MLRIGRCHPSSLFGDADGHDFIFVFVDGVENRRGREQRDFMLSLRPPKRMPTRIFFMTFSLDAQRLRRQLPFGFPAMNV